MRWLGDGLGMAFGVEPRNLNLRGSQMAKNGQRKDLPILWDEARREMLMTGVTTVEVVVRGGGLRRKGGEKAEFKRW